KIRSLVAPVRRCAIERAMSKHGPSISRARGSPAHDFAAEKDGFRYWRCRDCGLADANAFVAALAGRLAPGALLCLTIPDVEHWRRPKNLLDWDVFTPPRHCLFFTAAALRRLLAQHGLRTFERRPAFKPGLKVLAVKEGRAR